MRSRFLALTLTGLAGALVDSPAVHGAGPSAATCATAAYGSPQYHPVDLNPYALAAADFNEDGRMDLVTVNGGLLNSSPTVSVLLGNGLGGFGTVATTAIGTTVPSPLVVADVNGDGHADLLVGRFDKRSPAATLTVLLGDGTGSFGPPATFEIGPGRAPTALAVADVDRDGHLDAVVATVQDDDTFLGIVHFMKGDGAGAFASPVTLPVGVNAGALALADFNHDSRLDLAVAVGADPPSTGVQIRLGDGAGGFGPPVAFYVAPPVYSITTADLDEDGEVDLAIAATDISAGGSAGVLLGDGTGLFAAPHVLPVFDVAIQVVTSDVTGDGHLDLVLSGAFSRGKQGYLFAASVLRGDGNGNFGTAQVFPVRSGGALVAADFDADGRRDLALAGGGPSGGGLVAVLLSMCGNVADLAVSLADAPDPVILGQPLTYTVQVANNGPDPASATVGLRVPTGLSLLSSSSSAGDCVPATGSSLPSDRTIRCAVGDLAGAAPGNAATVTVVVATAIEGDKTARAAVATSVTDPTVGNNAATATTQVQVLGGRDFTIAAPAGGGAGLSWRTGDAQAGYVIGRIVDGVQTRIPPTGMLPAGATSYVDTAAVDVRVNCYQLAPMAAGGNGLNLSPVLCLVPGTASPPGALADFSLEVVDNDARMSWSPFGGQSLYVMSSYRTSGNTRFTLPGGNTGFVGNLTEPTCYVLTPVNGSTPLANSAALCGVPSGTGLTRGAAVLDPLPVPFR